MCQFNEIKKYFLFGIGLFTALFFYSGNVFSNYNNHINKFTIPADTDWNQLPVILNRITTPVFPGRTINIISLGAPVNGTTLATTYIQKAIDSCNKLGGGKVLIPSGTFLTGAITLKSNVNLYVSAGAILKFSTNTADYLPVVLTRFEGTECYNYSPFIYSNGATNIAVTGSGTLNGQASNSNWWAWKTSGAADVTSLLSMGENGTPVNQRIFGSGHKLRPVFIQLYYSTNILIDSVTIINSPMWEINPVLSKNVIVSNVNINSHGVNNDGCNPECCTDVWINHCTFSTGDDCIAIKSGRNNDGRRVNTPCQNIVIQNCIMQDGHGAITLGSECSGGIKNVFAENCTMNSSVLSTVLRFKTNSVRGGVIENIFIRNCTVPQVAGDIVDVNMYYEEGDAGDFTPVIRNIGLNNINTNKGTWAFNINCYKRSPLTDIKVVNCNFTNTTSASIYTNVCRMQVYNSFINGVVPLIPTTVAGYTEAESYNDKSSWGWSDVLSSYNGTGYMEFADSTNSIDWIVSVSKNEMDTINIRYANTDSINKPCTISVNGTNAGEIAFPSSQSNWNNCKKLIPLLKGTNSIRLVSVSSRPGVYIDRFSLVESPAVITRPDTARICPGDNIFFISGYQGNYNRQWQFDTGNGYTNVFNNEIFSGANADTLRLNAPSTSWYGYKFRCLVNGISNSNVYLLKFECNWTGYADTRWENIANWSCGSLPDGNTDVKINAGMDNYPVVKSNTNCRSIQLTGALSTVTVMPGIILTITGK